MLILNRGAHLRLIVILDLFPLLIEAKSVEECLLKLDKWRVLARALIVESHVRVAGFFVDKHVVEGGDKAIVASLEHIDGLKEAQRGW